MMDIEAEVRDLQRSMRGIPSRFAGGAGPVVYVLLCGQGNTLVTAGGVVYKGLKYPASAVTEVPAAVPAAIDTATPNGVSPAYLLSATGTSLVWIGTRLKPGVAAAVVEMTGSFYQETPIICRTIIQMPITGTPTVFAPVYVPFRI